MQFGGQISKKNLGLLLTLENLTSANLRKSDLCSIPIQRFLEVLDKLVMPILSLTPENLLLWTFLLQNFNLGIAKIYVILKNPVFPDPILPKTSVFNIRYRSLTAITPCFCRSTDLKCFCPVPNTKCRPLTGC